MGTDSKVAKHQSAVSVFRCSQNIGPACDPGDNSSLQKMIKLDMRFMK
jgi:hypothetical protein